MRRLLGSCLALTALLAMAAAPVAAGTRTAVSITATTVFDDVADGFVATGIPGCPAGTVSDGGAHLEFTLSQGIFAGDKVFDCGGDNGFVLRLNARFDPDGSVGTWSVLDAWGTAAGMSGAGKLTWTPIEGDGITDVYVGIVTR
jgi:hypothetical protein